MNVNKDVSGREFHLIDLDQILVHFAFINVHSRLRNFLAASDVEKPNDV